METAEVVIIGGGIVGSSIAWHLTDAGCRNVLVVERESHQGKGSTGKSMGGVRAQFATPSNIQMSMYSIKFYAEFDERLGQPGGYRPQGYLFVATAGKHLDYLRTNQALQHSLGLAQAQMVSREDILRRVPQLRSDDILGGSFCPTDGFVDPYSVMVGFTTCAVQRGARVWRSAEVTSIQRNASGITGVETTRGPVSTRVVVNAAGAWGAQVAALAGINLPVEPLRRQLVPTEPFDGVSREIPMVIDMTNGFHFRPESLGFLLAWNDPEETKGFKTDFDPSFIERILVRAADRVPCFENVAVNPKRAWAGLYEMSPDHHCILGPVKDVPGFFCANGFSGHGVMHSPSTGRILADLILYGKTAVVSNVEALSPARFAKGELLHETAVL
jgi:sarcosine oxidase subunit beta